MKRLLIITACLFMAAGAFAVSLQSVYDQCGPGEGYDKLLILNPNKVYTGGCGVLMNKKSCIRGNGALIDLDGNSIICNQANTVLTIEGCCFIGAGYYGAIKCEDYGRIVVNGNTICKSNGLAGIYVWEGCTGVIKNNIIFGNKTYGIAKHTNTLQLDILYNDVFNNPGGNYMYFCPG